MFERGRHQPVVDEGDLFSAPVGEKATSLLVEKRRFPGRGRVIRVIKRWVGRIDETVFGAPYHYH